MGVFSFDNSVIVSEIMERLGQQGMKNTKSALKKTCKFKDENLSTL
jgi:hypothetical protein